MYIQIYVNLDRKLWKLTLANITETGFTGIKLGWRAGKKEGRSLGKGSGMVVVTRVRPWDLKAAGGSCWQVFWERLMVSLSLTQFGKRRFSERQARAWNHIHNGHPASFSMPEPQWLHFYFLNVFFPFKVKAGAQCMFDGPQNKPF